MKLHPAIGVLIALSAGAAAARQDPSPAPAAIASPAARPAFSGRWRFDPAQSEDAHAKLAAARPEGRPEGGGGGGGGGHWGGGGHHGGNGGGYGGHGGHEHSGSGAGEPHPQRSEAMRDFFTPAEELTITQTETEIAILEKDGRLRALHPDGQAYKNEAGDASVRSHWEQGRLIVETTSSTGPKMTEQLGLDADKRQIVIQTTFEGRSGPVSVRRVYDAATAD